MSARRLLSAIVVVAALAAPASAAAAAPAWSIQSLAAPTNFAPGDASGLDRYQVFLTNSGGAVTDQSPITIVDTLPAGIEVQKVVLIPPRTGLQIPASACETEMPAAVATVSCEITDSLLPEVEPTKLYPGDGLLLEITVAVPADASGPLLNRVEVEGGGAPAAVGEGENQASEEDASAGFEEFHAVLGDEEGGVASAADSHPYQFTTTFGVNLVAAPPGAASPRIPAQGDLKRIEVALPPGLAANPTAIERCSAQDFITTHGVTSEHGGTAFPNECPASSAVGLALVQQVEGERFDAKLPIYNLVPPPGVPAQFGFEILGLPIYINGHLRSDGDYGASAIVENVTEARRATAARFAFWGTPWDQSHDAVRGECAVTERICPAEKEPARPFLRLPSSCANPLLTTMGFTTWAQPPAGAQASEGAGAPVGCGEPDFSPSVKAQTTTNVADSPSGFDFELHLPQAEHEVPAAPGEADLREVAVRLPVGLAVNPASASGRGSCSPTEVGLSTPPGQSPVHFDLAPAQCPDASKVGTVVAKAPALDHEIEGAVYLATQEENPFNSLIALYIVFEDPASGIVVKLATKVSPDPVSGRLTTTLEEAPQLPVEDFRFHFFEGARGPLRTPATCGPYTTTTKLTPWTAPEGPSTEPSDSFSVTSGPTGPCPSGALAPKFSAGLANPTAATYSPFSLRLTRADGSDEFAGLGATTPLSLTAKLAGIPYCPESGIAQAAARSGPREGAKEAASPSCPAASQIGTTTAGAGAGPTPFFTSGRLYLAGPYKGAPLSMVAIVPAVAGPFDLGVIVNRIALHVDPETAQVSAQSDPLPKILFGIPLDVRDIRVNLDRAGFTLAGTSCAEQAVSASVQGVSGATVGVSDRFQLGGCGALRFKPALSLKLKGGTKRSAHPALRAIVTYPQGSGYANTASASVGLPHSEFLDQAHIRTICTRVQFAAGSCPKGAIYGKAKAFTPILDKPLQGPVYLRSSSHPLPDMVLSLHGQIDAAAVGRIDSHNGGIRASFEAVPDVPLAKVIVEMQGGKKGLLVNSRNICNHENRATARFLGHNGKAYDFRPLLKDDCKGGGKKHKRG